MNTNERSNQPESATRAEHLTPDPSRTIFWAATELDQKLDALRRSNWLTEELIGFSQKHWHCTREQAIERLLAEPTASH